MTRNDLITIVAWMAVILGLGMVAIGHIGMAQGGRPEPDPYAPNQSRIQQLEAQVADHEILIRQLQIEVDVLWHRTDELSAEVACLESYMNFVLSDEYVDWLLDQLDDAGRR